MRNKSSRNYWTKVQDQAVIDYQKATTVEERSRIFNDHLLEPMKMIIGGMFVSFGNNLQYIHQDVMNDCSGEKDNSILSHMVKALDKIDTSKNTSFSYLTFTAKTTLMIANMRGKASIDRHQVIDYEYNDNGEYHNCTVPDQLIVQPVLSCNTDWSRYQLLCKDWWNKNSKYIFPDLDANIVDQIFDVITQNKVFGYKSLMKVLSKVLHKRKIVKILSRILTINQELYTHYIDYDNVDISVTKFARSINFDDTSEWKRTIKVQSKHYAKYLQSNRYKITVKNDNEVVTNDNQ